MTGITHGAALRNAVFAMADDLDAASAAARRYNASIDVLDDPDAWRPTVREWIDGARDEFVRAHADFGVSSSRVDSARTSIASLGLEPLDGPRLVAFPVPPASAGSHAARFDPDLDSIRRSVDEVATPLRDPSVDKLSELGIQDLLSVAATNTRLAAEQVSQLDGVTRRMLVGRSITHPPVALIAAETGAIHVNLAIKALLAAGVRNEHALLETSLHGLREAAVTAGTGGRLRVNVGATARKLEQAAERLQAHARRIDLTTESAARQGATIDEATDVMVATITEKSKLPTFTTSRHLDATSFT